MIRPVVFIHGFLGAPSDWDDVCSHIDSPSIAIQIPNVGDWNKTVEAIVANLPTQCELVGYSMGGRLAVGCALLARDKVRRLMVVSGSPGMNNIDRAKRRDHDHKIVDALRSCSSEPEKRAFLSQWYRQPVFHGLAARQIEELIFRRMALDEIAMTDLLLHLSVANQPDYRSQLREVSIDVLFLAGDRDAKYAALANEAAQLSERVHYEIIPDCGHIIPFEQPKRLATAISQFIQTPTRGN